MTTTIEADADSLVPEVDHSSPITLHAMVFDDSQTTGRLVGRFLKSLGNEVSVTTSGTEALELFCPVTIDLLVVDYNMPGKNGIELMKAIHARSPVTPVIMLTGSEDIELAVRAMRGGAIDFLTKFAAKDKLSDALDRAANWVRQQRAFKREACARREAERSLNQLNETLESRVKAQTADLAEKEAHSRAVIDSALDGIITIDSTGQIETFNHAAEKLFGHTAEAIIGKNIKRLMPSPHQEQHDGYLANYLKTGQKKVIGIGREAIGKNKDGSIFPIELSIAEVEIEGQNLFTGIVRDISERKKHEEEQEEMQTQLVDAAREAGKAEIATGVLHNIGNVLNSVNISVADIGEKLNASKVSRVGKIAEMLHDNSNNLADYLVQDPQGKQLPGYVSQLGDVLSKEQAGMLDEWSSLRENLDHIKKIVSAQQSIAVKSDVMEVVLPVKIIEDALSFQAVSLEKTGVSIQRDYEEIPELLLDRHKILQILINLVKNAKEAMRDHQRPEHQLNLRIAKAGEDRMRFAVADTGVGIEPANLSQIFAHGFTTKKDGHGFGLHHSANLATEMGGGRSEERRVGKACRSRGSPEH